MIHDIRGLKGEKTDAAAEQVNKEIMAEKFGKKP